MTGKLRIDWKRAVKYSWIAVCFSLLQTALASCLLDSHSSHTNDLALLYLVLLSFPSSIPAGILTTSFIDIYPSVDYTILCLVIFISGFLQWFWLVPKLVHKPKILSLNLTSHERETQPKTVTNPSRLQKPRPKLSRAPFDKTGLSPLERALGIKRV